MTGTDRTEIFGAREGTEGIVRCDACPVLCRIRPGRAGACSRYANRDGQLVRTDPLVLMSRTVAAGGETVPFLEGAEDWAGSLAPNEDKFVTAIGAGTTYPDYKPAPFIVASRHAGVDTVTVVTEGIFSYCGLKVKIDTDRHLGAECAPVRVEGEPIGHVTTAEYGSQMLSLGGVRHLTGGSKREGTVTCAALLALCNKQAVEVRIDGGATLLLQAGAAPVVDGTPERRMRVGCGSAAIGIFARQWHGHVDEVIVVDDHITGVLSEHQAGKCLGIPPSGIRVRGRRSTPGRYFQVAQPGQGWGGTDIADPLAVIERIDPATAWPGLRLLLTSTTGEDFLYVELDEGLRPVAVAAPEAVVQTVQRIGENCEPALTSILFMAGAGGSLRAGVTENPVLLTREVQASLVRVTIGGAPCTLWPGGGITIMADVSRVPDGAFGYVPTPALVAPIEFTLRADLYARLGGHVEQAMPLKRLLAEYGGAARQDAWRPEESMADVLAASLPDGRLHLQDGPIDLVIGLEGSRAAIAEARGRATAGFAGLLAGLVAELPLLRAPLGVDRPALRGPVAQRMLAATWPYRAGFITPMAAVAGAVAEQVLAALAGTPGLTAAHVNNGGDIAIFLAPGASLKIGVVPHLRRARPEALIRLAAADPVRGIATSGWPGRSFSRGIADAVTVLGATAAVADAAATIIANAVDAAHPAIRRAPARTLDPDSDLGDLLVTVAVGPLPAAVVASALEAGAARAEAMLSAGLICGAALALGDAVRVVGAEGLLAIPTGIAP